LAGVEVPPVPCQGLTLKEVLAAVLRDRGPMNKAVLAAALLERAINEHGEPQFAGRNRRALSAISGTALCLPFGIRRMEQAMVPWCQRYDQDSVKLCKLRHLHVAAVAPGAGAWIESLLEQFPGGG
jgi:hypothetical protein